MDKQTFRLKKANLVLTIGDQTGNGSGRPEESFTGGAYQHGLDRRRRGAPRPFSSRFNQEPSNNTCTASEPLLGLNSRQHINQNQLKINTGDLLILYTDSLIVKISLYSFFIRREMRQTLTL